VRVDHVAVLSDERERRVGVTTRRSRGGGNPGNETCSVMSITLKGWEETRVQSMVTFVIGSSCLGAGFAGVARLGCDQDPGSSSFPRGSEPTRPIDKKGTDR
jgi:hypothetical protein